MSTRGGRPARDPPDRHVRDPPPDPQTPPAGVRPSGGPREEVECPTPGDRQAGPRAVQLGPRRPSRGVPARGTSSNRLSSDATRPGARRPLGEDRAGVPRQLPGGVPPVAGGARVEARRGRNRGGDVLQEADGDRGPLQVGQGDVSADQEWCRGFWTASSRVISPRATLAARSLDIVTSPSLVTRLRRWMSRTSPGVGSTSYGGFARTPATNAILIAASISGSWVRSVVPASSTISAGSSSRARALRMRFRFVRSPCPTRMWRREEGNAPSASLTIRATSSGDAAWAADR